MILANTSSNIMVNKHFLDCFFLRITNTPITVAIPTRNPPAVPPIPAATHVVDSSLVVGFPSTVTQGEGYGELPSMLVGIISGGDRPAQTQS